MKLLNKCLAVAVAIPLLLSQASAASLPAIVTINGPGAGYSPISSVRGWGFQPTESFNIVALGIADIDNNIPPQFQLPGDTGGLATPHSIALWDAAGTQLATVTVQAGTASPVGPGAIGNAHTSVFRYENLASAVTVNAGSSYVISAFFQQNSGDGVASDPFQGALTFDSRIQTTGSRFGASPSHLFPTAVDTRFAFSAASFLIGDPTTTTTSSVPLPAGLPLLLGGLAAFGLVRRRT